LSKEGVGNLLEAERALNRTLGDFAAENVLKIADEMGLRRS